MRLSRSPVTAALLAAITVAFVLEILDPQIIGLGAIVRGTLQSGQYWRIFTAMFLHDGFVHLAVNCWALYQLGSLFEAMFGSGRFAFVYFVSGAVASIASSLTIRGASVGASGAILGVLGAFIFSIRRSPQWRHEPWTRSLISQLLFWAALNVALGFQVERIDNVAHIAGLTTGLILGFIPHRVPQPPPGDQVIDVQSAGDPGDRTDVR
jgi:rhomboid protease GluP